MDKQITPEIRVYLEGLLRDAGMTALDEQLKKDMVNELFVRLDQYLTSVIVDNLKGEDLEAFLKMSEEKKSMTEIQEYLKTKIPNVQEVFVRAFDDFRKMYLGNVALTRNAKDVMQETKVTQAATPKPIN